MKAGVAAAVAALATGAHAAYPHHRRAHDMFKRGAYETCVPGCTTIWSTITGAGTLVPNPPPATTAPVEAEVTTTSPVYAEAETTTSPAEAETTTSIEVVVVVPTPEVHDCPTPGTYTFPATTVTVSETTTVCAAQSTKVPSGTYTLGGVTTIVETATTVTCPYAKETEVNGVVTSVIDTTVYVCPSAGTYTIAPITKSCSEETVIVYPVPTTYAPGTYTAPAQTVTVTETGYVYVCPYTSSGLVAPTSTSAPQENTYKVNKVVSSSVAVAKASTTASSTKAKATSSYTGGSLTGTNDHFGITYTPYDANTGKCKSASAVRSDIQILKNKGFQIVRVYSTDCDTLTSVGPACEEFGLKMIIGVFVKETGCDYANTADVKTQVDAIASWAQWDLVELFVIGNEAIMNGYCEPKELADLITVVKSKCSGYTGPYTISETLNVWQQEDVASYICPVIDITGANIHPYFNSATEPSAAGEFVAGQLEILKDICSGNDVINLECGWPTSGVCNGVACPGESQQATAIQSIRESCGDKTVFFSYENDLWKKPGDCGCEQSWGSASCF